MAYVVISRDLSVVRHIADEVLVMYLGRPVEHGPRDTLFEQPSHPYTHALLAAMPQLNPAHRLERAPLVGELPSPLDPPSGYAFHTRCPLATVECRQIRPNCVRWIGGWWPVITLNEQLEQNWLDMTAQK